MRQVPLLVLFLVVLGLNLLLLLNYWVGLSGCRCQMGTNRSRAARVCWFSVACAASKQVLARRRYSSPLLVTTETPNRRYKRGRPLAGLSSEARSRKMAPRGATERGPRRVVIQCSRIRSPARPFQLASVKLVPAAVPNCGTCGTAISALLGEAVIAKILYETLLLSCVAAFGHRRVIAAASLFG